MTNLVKTEDSDYYRDTGTNALINTNVNAFRLYKQARESARKSTKTESQINELQKEIDDLKNLVKKLLEDKNG